MSPAQSTPRKILISVDGSSHSEQTLRYYLEKIKQPGDQPTLIFAAERPKGWRFLPELSTRSLIESERKILANAQKVMIRYATLLKENMVESKESIFPGVESARKTICEAANEGGYHLLVVGSRGDPKVFTRIFAQSMTDYCIHHANCPVLTVR